jgi:hypothetical protein
LLENFRTYRSELFGVEDDLGFLGPCRFRGLGRLAGGEHNCRGAKDEEGSAHCIIQSNRDFNRSNFYRIDRSRNRIVDLSRRLNPGLISENEPDVGRTIVAAEDFPQ